MLEYIIGLLIVTAITGGLIFAIPAVIRGLKSEVGRDAKVINMDTVAKEKNSAEYSKVKRKRVVYSGRFQKFTNWQ